MTTKDRLDLRDEPALAELVAATASMTSTLPPAHAAGATDVLTAQVRASLPGVGRAAAAVRARRRRQVMLVVPALAAAAAGALVITTPGSPAPTVEAGAPLRQVAWSPVGELLATPEQPAADVDDSLYWTTACRAHNGNEAYVGRGAAAASARAVHHVLVERRAGSILCVDVAFGDGTPGQPTVALGGLTTPEGNGQFSSASWQHHRVQAPAGGEISVLDGESTSAGHRGEASNAMLYGAAGAQVRAVEVVLASGQHVTASVHDGIWAAWWPLARGQATGAQLVVTTATAQRTIEASTVRVPDDVPAQPAPPATDPHGEQSAPQPDQPPTDPDAIPRRIVACLQEKGYPVVVGGGEEMTGSAGASSLYWTVPGVDPNDPTYRVLTHECTAAAKAALSPSPS